MELRTLDIKKTLEGYRSGEFKPTGLIEQYLGAIEATNGESNAYLQTRNDDVLQRASEVEKGDSNLPLYGIPVAVKDNFLVQGWQTTAGSKILKGYTAPYTATSVARLQEAGAIVVGKTNLDEFAMGSSNENSAYGPVKNPWDSSRVPGGSSGGSAAAVASSTALASLGTDTGGSIRQPASFCGLVGLKPTYGRISRYGIVAFGSSLDQVGPFTKDVWGCARMMEVMSGFDPFDSTSSKHEVPKYTESLDSASVNGVRIGIAADWMKKGLGGEVQKNFEESVEKLKSAGAEIIDISLPNAQYGLSVYYLLAPSEASSNLARFDGVHYGFRADKVASGDELYMQSRGQGFGPEVKLRIMLGTYALSAGYYDAYYVKANKVRELILHDFKKAFESCDTILAPTSPSTAFGFGDHSQDPIQMYLSDVFTLPANLIGSPAISVPSGLDSEGLPIGLQFIGKHFDESHLFQYARAFEQIRGDFELPKVSS